MTPPRASNQVSLWLQSHWVGHGAFTRGWRLDFALKSIEVVDQAILKMMEKGDE